MATTIAVWLHWYVVAFFILFGAGMIMGRNCFAGVGPLIRVRSIDAAYEERLRAAIVRRDRLEALPGAAMALTVASASLAAAVLAVLTSIPVVLLYAVLCAVLAGTLAIAYVGLRRAGMRRVASLRARTPGSVLPWWLQTFVAVACVSPLTFIDVAPLAAMLVTVASLGIAVLGERVAQLPALLGDEDPVVDAYVDERLRAVRAVNLVGTATAPAYVFECITLVQTYGTQIGAHGRSGLQALAMLFVLAALIVACGQQFALMRRTPGAGELERWARVRV